MSAKSPDTTLPRSPSGGFDARIRAAMAPIFIVVILGGLGAWGWLTEWHFGLVSSPLPVTNQPSHLEGLSAIRLNPTASTAALADIEFKSAEEVGSAGIDVAAAWTGPITEFIPANGEIRFSPAKTARLSSRTAGTAWRVFKTAGDTVKAGELLAIIDAADVGHAKADFQQALVQERLAQNALTNAIAAGSALSEAHLREAEAAARNAAVKLLSAEQALVNLGFPVDTASLRGLSVEEAMRQLRLLGVSETEIEPGAISTANLLPVRSPLGGEILASDVVTGEVVDAARVIFVVVDPRKVWLTLHIAENQKRQIRIGQTVRFRPDGSTDEFSGPLVWIGTAADEATRTIPVRVELDNLQGRLRASTLGVGQIVVRTEPNAILLPNEAVVTWRGASLVFVRDPDYLKPNGRKLFQVRVVQVGARDVTNTEIRSGLKKDDVVASKGATVLLNEFKRAAESSAEWTLKENSRERKPAGELR